MEADINQSVQFCKGVGPQLAKRLQKLGIVTIKDLLYYFPKVHENRSDLPRIAQLKPDEYQCVIGQLVSIAQLESNPKVLQGIISDGSGSIAVIWFNQPFLKKTLTMGCRVYIRGKLMYNRYQSQYQVHVSEHEVIEDLQLSNELTPIYALTYGLTNVKLRQLTRSVMTMYVTQLTDPLPLDIRQKNQLLPLDIAIKHMHFPKDSAHFKLARKRVAFDELFFLQLPLLYRKVNQAQTSRSNSLTPTGTLTQQYRSLIPYVLTNAQERAINQIKDKIIRHYPMNQLLQGDVGSGKTDIAIMALLMAIESKKKGALMAPTEILSTQHYLKLSKLLSPLDISIVLLKGQMPKKQRERIKQELAGPDPLIVIGTHALLEDDIVINQLGLVVIDEQHRFGVMQRLKLKVKGIQPHCLFMTATPIPRSMMLTLYGDLDKTIIDELPPGRTPCKTVFIREFNQQKVIDFCQSQIHKGFQVYMVLPLVDDSEKVDLKSAVSQFNELQHEAFSQIPIGLLHGQMKTNEKEEIMQQFRDNKLKVLVTTTVIEVGVDVPNATTMVIYHAHRFGLSQLHQLRGRVGRGSTQSYCFLVADPKTPESKKRLNAMVQTTDGFKLAEIDLSIRGPGDLLGTRQSGSLDLSVADLIQDQPLVQLANTVASAIIHDDVSLQKPKNKVIREQLISQYGFFLNEKLN